MKKDLIKKLIIAGAITLGMVGCASNSGSKSDGYSSKNMKTAGLGDRSQFYGQDITAAEEKDLLAQDTIYFGFDNYEISASSKRVLYAHARKLLDNPNSRLRIEGHADRRGSRAYNLSLGERRAHAAKQVLLLKGVSDNQIAVLSYGKEKPAALGSSDNDFALNRRDSLVLED